MKLIKMKKDKKHKEIETISETKMKEYFVEFLEKEGVKDKFVKNLMKAPMEPLVTTLDDFLKGDGHWLTIMSMGFWFYKTEDGLHYWVVITKAWYEFLRTKV